MKMILYSLMVVLIVPSICSVEFSGKYPAKIKSPVILVPGDGGSQIWANLTGKPDVPHYNCYRTTKKPYLLWLSFLQLIPVIQADCLIDNLKLIYNVSTHLTSNPPGVDISVPGWGDTSTVENIDTAMLTHPFTYYYSAMVSRLVGAGYERGKSVRGAPFDFRKAPSELSDFFIRFQKLVEDTYYSNHNTKVTIVTHSYGGPLVAIFLNKMNQAWKNKFVKSLASIGGVWGGSVKSILTLSAGYDLDIFILKPWANKFRNLQRTLLSTKLLLPSTAYWGSDEILSVTPTKNYSISNFDEFFEDIGHPVGWQMYQDVAGVLGEIKAPGVPVHCMYGVDVPTPDYYRWKRQSQFPDSVPEAVNGNGDGTVNLRSLQGCLRWRGQPHTPVYDQPFSLKEHRSMIKDETVIDYIMSIL